MVRDGTPAKINTKVYTSIEEVVSDYANNDNFNTLIFYEGMASVPIKLVSRDGEAVRPKFFGGDPSDGVRLESLHPYIKRNFLLKTSTIIPILEKWSNLGLRYGEEIKKIVDFIRRGKYSWIANVFRGFDMTDVDFRAVKDFSREHLEDIKYLMDSLERDTISSFFEKSFRLAWENHISYWVDDTDTDSLDFDVGEEEERFAKAVREAEDFFRGPKSVSTYPAVISKGEKLLAIFSRLGKEEAGKLFYGKTWDIVKTKFSSQDNSKSLKLLEEEWERYNKMGVLSLFPEIFYFEVGGEEEKEDRHLYEYLSILQSRPEDKEIGLVLVGHGKVSKYSDLSAFFLPFVATKSKTAIKLSIKTTDYGSYQNLIRFDSKNHNPVIVAYESESSKKEKPKFQIFSFSYGPMIYIKATKDEKERYLYAPMVEHVFYSQKGERSIRARRGFIENPDKMKMYIKREDMTFSEEMTYNETKEIHRKIVDLINLPSLSRTYTRQVVEVDPAERNKIVEMAYFVEEKLEGGKGTQEKERPGIVLRDPEEVIGVDEIEERIVKDLCYTGEGERVYVKAISRGLTKDERNILRVGAVISGNLHIETSGTENYFPKDVKNLYDAIFVNLKRILTQDSEGRTRQNLSGLLTFIRRVSEMSEEVGKAYRITIERDGEKEIYEKIKDPKIKLIRNSEKMAGFGIARMAREVLPELTKMIEKSNGPNIIVMIDYNPRVELHLSTEDCVDEEEGEYDLETLIEEGCDPEKVGINSVLEKTVIFLDFKEEGLRVASINLYRS
jgi:hypothetical protein